MAAHRHFTSKLLMKWRDSDGLQLLNWQSLKLLVLRSQVSSINHHCYWFVVGFVGRNFRVCSDFTAELWFSRTYMFRILRFRDYPFPCHCFNLGDWFSRIKDVMWPHGWLAGGRQVGFQSSSALVQTTLSSVRLCLLLSEVLCFHAVWNETLLWSFSVFSTSKNCISDNHLCFLMTFYTFINVISWI